MTTRSWRFAAITAVTAAAAAWSLGSLKASAQESGAKPKAPTALAPKADAPARAKEVTLTGRVVDLQCAMTGEYPSADHAKCTADCIRSGVPAGLETSDGIIILGQGRNGPGKTLVPLAFEQVQAKGKLYEKGGVRYLDVASVEKSKG